MQPPQPLPPLEPLPFPLSLKDIELIGVGFCIAGVLFGLFHLWRWDQRRRLRASRALAVTSCGFDYLRDVQVPDGQGGGLHVDFLLLTARGVVVIDLRDIAGNIFGGDQMTEWTVMHRALRYTFVNPQTGLYDRIAAVRALAQDLPVEGRIVFTNRGRFPKGLPRHTVMLESLPAEFPTPDRQTLSVVLERWQPTWDLIKKSAVPSKLAMLKAVAPL